MLFPSLFRAIRLRWIAKTLVWVIRHVQFIILHPAISHSLLQFELACEMTKAHSAGHQEAVCREAMVMRSAHVSGAALLKERRMYRPSIIGGIVLLSYAASPLAFAASFDCNKAHSLVEYAICTNAELSSS